MASLKAEKPVGTQLFGQKEKEPAGAGGSTKAPASKPAPKKSAAPKKTVEPKTKAAGVKKSALKKK